MIGNILDKIFRYTFTIMKLNFMFLMVTMMGGIVLGIGPAFLTISDLYVSYKFEHESMHFSKLNELFRRNFKRGNALFYSYGIITFIVVYNLFLSFQMKTGYVLFLQVIMIVMIVFLAISYLYANIINAYYNIKLFDLIKLSSLSFFANIIQLIRFGISLAAIYFIFKVIPALLLFGIFSLLVIVSAESLSSWIKVVEETIDYQ